MDYVLPHIHRTPADAAKQKGSYSGFDKRHYKRFEKVMPVAYRLANPQGGESPGKGKLAQALNVSTGGLLLQVKELLHEQSLLDVAFDLSGKDQPIKRLGRVVRCEPSKEAGSYEAGIMFLAMTAEERSQIEGYLNLLEHP